MNPTSKKVAGAWMRCSWSSSRGCVGAGAVVEGERDLASLPTAGGDEGLLRESSRSIARFSRLSRLSEAGVRPFAVGFVDPRWTELSTARVRCPLPPLVHQREQNDNAEDRCDGSRAAAADKLSASRSRGRARRGPQGGQVALRHPLRPLLALALADVEGVWGGQDVAVDICDEEHLSLSGFDGDRITRIPTLGEGSSVS